MRASHGSGRWSVDAFAVFGAASVIEDTALVFHPERIEIGAAVYVGHQAVLKGYHRNRMVIGDGVWIGEQTYLSSAGGLRVGRNVGIGPGTRIITSRHAEAGIDIPILHSPIDFAEVTIGDDCDLGAGCIVLPGVRIGRGVQVAAGAVVTRDLPDHTVAAGVPARVVRRRDGSS